jgi:MFS family permease
MLARLIAGQVSVHACMTGLRLALPLYALKHGHSAAEAGLLVALFAASNVLLALPWGRLADRYGLHRPWLLVVAMSVSGAAVVGLEASYWAYAVAALLVGGAVGLAQVTVHRRAGMVQLDAQARRELWGWLSLAPPAANLFGPVLAGLLLDHAGTTTLDLNALRWTCAVLGLLALSSLFWMRGVAEKSAGTGRTAQATGAKRELLGDWRMRRLLVTAWAVASCWDVHAFVVPMLGHERGFSASVIGLILGAFALSAALSRPLLPRLTAGWREHRLMGGCLLATGVLLAVYPWAPNAWVAGTLSLVLGATLGALQPVVLSLLQQITPAERMGQALGLRLMTVSATSVVMPLLFGTSGAVVGVTALFWGAGAIALLGARVASSLGPAQAQAQAPAQAPPPPTA